MEDNQPLSISTLRAELTALELRIVDRLSAALDAKADKVHLDQIEIRVNSLELSRASRETLPVSVGEIRERLIKLERFRYAVPGTAVLSLIVAAATLIWFALATH